MRIRVLSWEEAVTAGVGVVGGKGWNLGRLNRYGFPVPVGGVLPADAYARFMARPELQERAAGLKKVREDDVEAPEVATHLKEIQAAIEHAAVPDEIETAVRDFLAGARLDTAPVAVRSSATAEDSPDASFAGMHRSFLGVTGSEAVIDAVRGCYAALWSDRAVAYRRRSGFEDERVKCAVVICAMIGGREGGPPVAAGVAFSCDPRTGRRDCVTISAATGIGEKVVSGEVNTAEIRVDVRRGQLVLAERSADCTLALEDDQAVSLARLVIRVHWALGEGQNPQDVEWAYDGDRLWLLQARPVTHLPRVTFAGASELPTIWSNANIKDAMGGVLTPLTWSVLQAGFRILLFAAIDAAGFPVPSGMETSRRFCGRAYFDLTAVLWAFYDALGVRPEVVNRSMGGHQPAITVPRTPIFAGRAGLRRIAARARLLWHALENARRYPGAIRRVRDEARRLNQIDLSSKSAGDLLKMARRLVDQQIDFGRRFQLANSTMVWNEYLQAILDRFRPGEGASLAASLMSGGGEVVSAKHGYRLLRLAATAKDDAGARSYLAERSTDPNGWRQLPEGSPFRQQLERFLEEFGHRAVDEAEFSTPRWREDPGYLLDQVRSLVEQNAAIPEDTAARDRRKSAELEVTRLPSYVRPLIRWMAAQARTAAALREAGKSALISMIEPVRGLALETGRRLVEEDALDDKSQIFYLAWEDCEAYLLGEWKGAGARNLTADRAALRKQWQNEHPEDIYIVDASGQPARLSPAPDAPPESAGEAASETGNGLAGVAVSAGRGSGPARIIRDPREGNRLQPGDVLVAPSTDPAWTPLFLRAKGVATEVGGYLSHGAIVAREYGVPAVVNVPGLLDKVKEGAIITVDGDTGRVELNGKDG